MELIKSQTGETLTCNPSLWSKRGPGGPSESNWMTTVHSLERGRAWGAVCVSVCLCVCMPWNKLKEVECCFVNRCVMECAVICVYSLHPCVMETVSNSAAASSCVCRLHKGMFSFDGKLIFLWWQNWRGYVKESGTGFLQNIRFLVYLQKLLTI